MTGDLPAVVTERPDARQAGLDGLHAVDCWSPWSHQDCMELVDAVLDAVQDAGYRIVLTANDGSHP